MVFFWGEASRIQGSAGQNTPFQGPLQILSVGTWKNTSPRLSFAPSFHSLQPVPSPPSSLASLPRESRLNRRPRPRRSRRRRRTATRRDQRVTVPSTSGVALLGPAEGIRDWAPRRAPKKKPGGKPGCGVQVGRGCGVEFRWEGGGLGNLMKLGGIYIYIYISCYS